MSQRLRRYLQRQPVRGPPVADIEETPVRGVNLKSASDPAVKEKAEALLGVKAAGEKEPPPEWAVCRQKRLP